MELTRPKAILFDWDNTLVDTWPIIHQALHDTMSAWNMTPWTLEEVKLKVGKSMRDSFPEMFGDEWEKAGDYYLNRYRAYHLEQLQPLEGATALLDFLVTTPLFIGVVSNKRGDSLRLESSHLDWDAYFHTLVGASDAPRDKPYPDPALLALQKSNVQAGQEVWFVGDTTTDLECAKACGMTAILYGDVTAESDFIYRGFPFARHTRSHEDLLALLKEYA